jgi:hypothetical protein
MTKEKPLRNWGINNVMVSIWVTLSIPNNGIMLEESEVRAIAQR